MVLGVLRNRMRQPGSLYHSRINRGVEERKFIHFIIEAHNQEFGI